MGRLARLTTLAGALTTMSVALAVTGCDSGTGAPAEIVTDFSRTGVATATSTPSPTTSPADSANSLPPDFVIAPAAVFDFTSLPAIDQSSWKTTTGPNGLLSVRTPLDWIVLPSSLTDATGKALGDAITVYKPIGKPVDAGVATPGWVKVDLSTASMHVPIVYGDDLPCRTVQLARTVNGRDVTLTAQQFGRSSRFPDILGQVMFLPNLRSASGIYLSGAAWAWLPATAGDIAIARAVIESVVLK